MPYRIAKTLMLGGALLLALSMAAAAQGNLEADRGVQSTTSVLSLASATALEASLIRDGLSPGVLAVPAADFADDGAQPNTAFFAFSSGEFSGSSANYGCLMAPAYLPDGVTVSEMNVRVHDGDPAFSVQMDLRKVDNFSGTSTLMASVTTLGSPGEVILVTSDITDPLVTHPDDSIYLTTCVLSPDVGITAVWIYFEQLDE